MIVFYNVDISMNRMKNAFLCNLWSWTHRYIVDDRPRFLVEFLTWLGTAEGW